MPAPNFSVVPGTGCVRPGAGFPGWVLARPVGGQRAALCVDVCLVAPLPSTPLRGCDDQECQTSGGETVPGDGHQGWLPVPETGVLALNYAVCASPAPPPFAKSFLNIFILTAGPCEPPEMGSGVRRRGRPPATGPGLLGALGACSLPRHSRQPAGELPLSPSADEETEAQSAPCPVSLSSYVLLSRAAHQARATSTGQAGGRGPLNRAATPKPGQELKGGFLESSSAGHALARWTPGAGSGRWNIPRFPEGHLVTHPSECVEPRADSTLPARASVTIWVFPVPPLHLARCPFDLCPQLAPNSPHPQ